MTDDEIKGRVMAGLIYENPVEMLDECRCGNSFLMTPATGHRLTPDDINQLVAYIHYLEHRLGIKENN